MEKKKVLKKVLNANRNSLYVYEAVECFHAIKFRWVGGGGDIVAHAQTLNICKYDLPLDLVIKMIILTANFLSGQNEHAN